MPIMTKREIAQAVLRELLANEKRVAIADAVAVGRKRGVSRRTLTRACADLGIREVHNGPFGGFWEKGEK